NCVLYPFWDDLNPASAGAIKYYADAANHRFIVAWLGVVRYGTTDPQTFEVVIQENGGITFNYQTVGLNNACTVGVENCTGTDALQLYFNGVGPFAPLTSTAVAFWGGPSSSISGVVRGQSPTLPIAGVNVTVNGRPETGTTDASGTYTIPIEPGTYTVCFHHAAYCDTCYANVLVEAGTQTSRNATMRQPRAVFSVTSITRNFSPGVDHVDSFSIANTGGQCLLTYSIMDSSASWIGETPASGTIAPNTTQWIRYTVNIPLAQIYRTSIMVTYNYTGSPTRIPVEINGVNADELNPASIPTVFALHQNYPNPFNPSTALRFDVPRDSRVDIVVFNMMGQEVAHPVSGVYNAGRHQAIFDANNLPSGVYMAKMTAGDFTQFSKMMMLK
ncbi:MAG: carboxypeptidase regulatory-like domain-containing protein, partial [Ignavibacteriales bacterium]|nr:carboxypeptidase regulatory-like domain-containing protein [Ignavibacteriales bacterium]